MMITTVFPHFWQLKHPTEVKNHFVFQTFHFSFRQFFLKRLFSSDASFGSNLLAWRLREPCHHCPLTNYWSCGDCGITSVCLGILQCWAVLFVFMKNLQNLSPGNE
jgi:hypothetical protein